MGRRTDNNYLSHGDTSNVLIINRTIVPPSGTDDSVKLSNVKGAHIVQCDITGGNEEVIDIMRLSEDVNITLCTLRPKGKGVIVAKGGSKRITITDTVIVGSGTSYDIELGQFADKHNDPTSDIVINNVRKADNSPVRIICWNVDRRSLILKNGNYKVIYVPKLIWKTYFFLRKTGILR
jgi:hypothetical protein